jgi:DNA invertase Pin-like site-specific DNA recombinase
MKPKIGAYLRVSTTDQDVKSQRHAIREWAKLNHVPASEIRFYEDRKSGTTADRSQLKKLLWAVDKGRVDTVVVFRLDRLARNLRDGLGILADLADKGIRVVSISENIDFGSSTGRLIASILLAVASFERDTIVERIKAGMDAARANGKRIGRPRNEKRLSKIRTMRDKGATVIQIAEKLGCSRANVYAALAKTA